MKTRCSRLAKCQYLYHCILAEGPALKRKPTPPKGLGRRASEEEKADTENDEQELVTVTKVVEEVRKIWTYKSRDGTF